MGKKNVKQLVGLDFGTDIIRAVQVTRHGRDRVLQRYHEIKLPAGAIDNDLIKDEKVAIAALQQLWRDARFSTKNIVLGLGNQQVLVREMTVQKMKIEHINETLPYQVTELLPIPVDQAVVQFYPTGEIIQGDKAYYTGLMVATARSVATSYVALVKAAGLKLVDIDYTSFAVLRGLNGEKMRGTELIVDVRSQGTNLIIAEDGSPRFVRYLNSGSIDLLSPVPVPANSINEEETEADETGTTTQNDPHVLHTDHLAGLVQDIHATIMFYQNGHPGTQVTGIVLLCEPDALDGLDTGLRQSLNLPTRFGIPEAKFKFGRGLHEEEFLTTGSSLVAALGLALRN